MERIMLYLYGARVLTPEREIDDSAVLVENGRIVAVGARATVPPPGHAETRDVSGLILAPGLIELQLNGGFGLDFAADPGTIWQVAGQLPRYGVTAFLPTIVTSPREIMTSAQELVRSGPPEGFQGAQVLGLHPEGPFLNPAKRGAHNPAYLRAPSVEYIADWSPENGIRLVTLAPELEGALDVVRLLASRGVVVSAGHSMATYDEARAGFDAGITYGTHLFNAMPPLDHRAPNLPGALLTDPRVTVGIIPDGIHVHPTLVDLAYRSKGAARLSVVTDAMGALGMPPGRYRLGDFEVNVDETSARLDDGRLAGSILAQDQALRNLTKFTGCSPSDALATLTTTPAALVRHPDRGRIAPGYRADFVLLTRDLHVAETWVGGKPVWGADVLGARTRKNIL